jgi:hypothetical protein
MDADILLRLRERRVAAIADIDDALAALEVRRSEEKQANGPRACCADWAFVTDCVDGIDSWKCGCCDRRWEMPCAN